MEEIARARTGLILGKFMPLHRGHMSLIETALARVDHLTILVCSRAGEPIAGELRCVWVRELVPSAHVVSVTDENPSDPAGQPRFWDLWTATIRRALPEGPDLVFSGEFYGEEVARRLGAGHVLVDRTRSAFPVSASQIRADPLRHWDELLPPVRAHYVRRVVLSGSESTGKTTLARTLADRYGTVRVEEFGRAYLDRKGSPLDASDIEPIARGQLAAEERLAREANRVLILDTDLASTEIYANHYYGFCPEWIRAAALERRPDLYLLGDIDVPWVPDPQRDRPHMRESMHGLFQKGLEESGARVVTLRGSWAKRLETARAEIDALLERESAS